MPNTFKEALDHIRCNKVLIEEKELIINQKEKEKLDLQSVYEEKLAALERDRLTALGINLNH